MKINKIVAALAIAAILAPGLASAEESGVKLLAASPNLSDLPSLQRGAKLFVNYCLSCHSTRFARYKRMGEDIGLTDEEIKKNLLFTGTKIQNEMTVAMRPAEAEKWFGVAPPDLSVIARARGADWLYSYLVTFYADSDPSRPFGVNNVVFPKVGMPDVLWPLQGVQKYVPAKVSGKISTETITGLGTEGDAVLIHKDVTLADGKQESVIDRLEPGTPGSVPPGIFRRDARDIVNFLVYMSEPAQLVRYDIGLWVLAFLAALIVLTRALYKEYWKDVH